MTFKPLNTNDITFTRTLLHEAIPLTGTIISGTYGVFPDENNIKNYSHGMFQSVFDYPYLSSSANHIFDITTGIATQSTLYANITTTKGQKSKKKNIYNQMSQVLMGYDYTGSILQFDEDGDIIGGGAKMNEVFIIPFARLLSKDEIKKETFELKLGVHHTWNHPMDKLITISDVSASTQYRVNSPVGEYGILYATGAVGEKYLNNNKKTYVHTASINGQVFWYAGLLFYQAGVAVLTASIFGTQLDEVTIGGELQFHNPNAPHYATSGNPWQPINHALTGSGISGSADALRHRIYNLQYNNTTELNSTVYFCRANHNEFNYSSNPTYLSNSKIRVKTMATDNPVAYITSVGLYNDNNELLASAKLSEPLKKSPSTEFTIRARLDY